MTELTRKKVALEYKRKRMEEKASWGALKANHQYFRYKRRNNCFVFLNKRLKLF